MVRFDRAPDNDRNRTSRLNTSLSNYCRNLVHNYLTKNGGDFPTLVSMALEEFIKTRTKTQNGK